MAQAADHLDSRPEQGLDGHHPADHRPFGRAGSMSRLSDPRPLTADEFAEAQAHAYAAHWLTGRSAIDVIDCMQRLAEDAVTRAQRGEVEQSRRMLLIYRAGLDMVRESLAAKNANVTVSTDSPILQNPGASR